MKPDMPQHPAPDDGDRRKAVRPVICYPVDGLPHPDLAAYRAARPGWTLVAEVLVPAREARVFEVPAGHFSALSASRGRRWAI